MLVISFVLQKKSMPGSNSTSTYVLARNFFALFLTCDEVKDIDCENNQSIMIIIIIIINNNNTARSNQIIINQKWDLKRDVQPGQLKLIGTSW